MQNPIFAEYHSEEFEYDFISTTDFSLSIPTHTHLGWEFLLVKSGELTYTVDGNVFHIAPNNLIISRPGAVHTLYSTGAIRYDRHDLIVSENLLSKRIMKQIPEDLHVLGISDKPIISNLFEKIGFYLSNVPGEELELLLCGLIHELCVNLYLITRQSSESVVTNSNAVVTKTINYIKEHIQEPLTVQQLCKDLFISPSHLHHCFAAHMNMTVKKYIMLQKLQLVQQLLANNINPTEACRQYGFRNYSTFFRNYQNIFGCRPSDSPQQALHKIEL